MTSKLTICASLALTVGAASLVGRPLHAQNVQLASFDSAWTIIQRTHFDTTFNGLDWPRVREELRPQAEGARSNEQLRAILMEMVQRLAQSHFSIISQEAAEANENAAEGDLGLDVRWVQNALTVTRVDPRGPAAAAHIKPGWVLLRVDNFTVDSMIARARRGPAHYRLESLVPRLAQARLSGAPGSTAQLELRDARDQRVTANVIRRPAPGVPVKFGNLPTFQTRFDARRASLDGFHAGIIEFNYWMVPVVARVDSAVDRERNAHGIIIDLRGNPGGVGAMSVGVAGHFMDTTLALGTMQTRTNRLEFRINPRRTNTAGQRVTPFTGPVAILTDELTGSTSEVFTGGLQALGRVRVFGARSMGAVLPAAMNRLPNGDVLYHAIADFRTPDGTLLEGRGVIPDEPIELKRVDLLDGRDPVLETALRWIVSQAGTKSSTPEETNHE